MDGYNKNFKEPFKFDQEIEVYFITFKKGKPLI